MAKEVKKAKVAAKEVKAPAKEVKGAKAKVAAKEVKAPAKEVKAVKVKPVAAKAAPQVDKTAQKITATFEAAKLKIEKIKTVENATTVMVSGSISAKQFSKVKSIAGRKVSAPVTKGENWVFTYA